jgi:hypothetical protein
VACPAPLKLGASYNRFSTPRTTSEKRMASLVNTLRTADEIVLYLVRSFLRDFRLCRYVASSW